MIRRPWRIGLTTAAIAMLPACYDFGKLENGFCANHTEAFCLDAGTADAGSIDSGLPADAGSEVDAGGADGAVPDSGANDGGPGDAGTTDSGSPATWRQAAYDGGRDLYGIWGVGPTEIMAVGDGVIARFDGQWNVSWTSTGQWPNFVGTGIWGYPTGGLTGEYWISGLSWSNAPFYAAATFRWDGMAVTAPNGSQGGGSINAVSGQTGQYFWSVGSNGTRYQNSTDGGPSNLLGGISPPTPDLYAVWTPPVPGEVWWGGVGGTNGTSAVVGHNTVPTGTPDSLVYLSLNGRIWALWGSSATDIWAVGAQGTLFHNSDGGFFMSAWQPTTNSPTTQDLRGIWGVNASEIWAVGFGGTILHWNGGTWSPEDSGTTTDLYGVWGTDPNNVWAVGADGGIFHRSP